MTRTVVVLALEPQGAAQLISLLAAGDRLRGTGVMLLDASGRAGPDLLRRAAPGEAGTRLVVTGAHGTAWLAAHRENPGAFDILYLRTTAVTLWELVIEQGAFPDPVMALRRRFAEFLDQMLREFPQISLEDLHFAPGDALATLLSQLGLPQPSLPAPVPAPEPGLGYARSMAALRDLGGPGGEELNALLELRLGEPRRIGRGHPGSLILGRGWSYQEVKLVWSDGDHATLAVPLPPDAEGPLCCRLSGMVAKTPFTLRASIRGAPVGTFIWPAGSQHAAVVDLPLTLTARSSERVVPIDFAFEGFLTPDPSGPTDPRRLGIALQSVQIYPARSGPDRDASAASMFDVLLAAGCRPPAPIPAPVPAPPTPALLPPERTRTVPAALRQLADPRAPRLALLLLGSQGEALAAALPLCEAAEVVLAVADALPAAAPDPRLLLWEGGAAAALQLLDGLAIPADLVVAWNSVPLGDVLSQGTAAAPRPCLAHSVLVTRTDPDGTMERLQRALDGTAGSLLAFPPFVVARLGRRSGA
ncbi:hypothetical protein [Roseomonas sp. BN140053]|uniref:hypothetical protein n=1 Tax=Roseomonas sp. BN140053 TaxID=3391898 RepID=UPI0039EABD8B